MKSILNFSASFLLSIVGIVICNAAAAQSYIDTLGLTGPVGGPTINSLLRIDDSNNKWALTRGLLYKYNNQNAVLLPVSYSINDVDFFQGKTWLATKTGVVCMVNDTINTVYNTQNSPLLSDSITAIETFDGGVYIGTYSGLYKFDGLTWTSFTTQNSQLVSNTIHYLSANASSLYIATPSGVSVKNSNNWSSITTANGLSSNNIVSLATNQSGVAWIVTKSTINQQIIHNVFRYVNGALTNFSLVDCDLNEDLFTPILGILNEGDLIFKNQNKFYRLPAIGFQINRYVNTISFATLGNFGGETDPNNVLWLAKGIGDKRIFKIDFSAYPVDSIQQANLERNGDYAELYINKVKAGVSNRGDMHWDYNTHSRYEVPRGSCKNAGFATGLWLGGVDNGGNLKLATTTYRQAGVDYWPGPIDSVNMAFDSTIAAQYNNVWNIDKGMIQEFISNYANGNVANGSYTIPPDILTWPANGPTNYAQNLAPFVDVNNNGIYNPYEGDYPKITGDQMLFSMYNDLGGPHSESGGLPIGVEVHSSAYAYACDAVDPNSPDEALNYTTFYKYDIYNRSSFTVEDFYIGLWADAQLGNYNDDFIGCDTAKNVGFVYNGDNDDEGFYGYGNNPPMQSYVVLKGPLADANDERDNDNDGIVDEPGEECLLNVFSDMRYKGVPPQQDYGQNIYNFLRGFTGDSFRMYNPDSQVVTHVYPGVPYSGQGWSEQTINNTPGNKRFLISSGPFTLLPGMKTTIEYAVVFSHKNNVPNGLNSSIALNNTYVDKISQWYANGSFPSCYAPTGVEENSITGNDITVYPNPTNGLLNVVLNNVNASTVQVIDVTGRVVKTMGVNNNYNLVIDAGNLAAGLYTLVVNTPGKVISKRFIKE